MTEVWRSTPKHWCMLCKIYIADTKSSIRTHEEGRKHKENAQRYRKEATVVRKDKEKKEKLISEELERINALAERAYNDDVRTGIVESRRLPPRPGHHPSLRPPGMPTHGNLQADYLQAVSLHIMQQQSVKDVPTLSPGAAAAPPLPPPGMAPPPGVAPPPGMASTLASSNPSLGAKKGGVNPHPPPLEPIPSVSCKSDSQAAILATIQAHARRVQASQVTGDEDALQKEVEAEMAAELAAEKAKAIEKEREAAEMAKLLKVNENTGMSGWAPVPVDESVIGREHADATKKKKKKTKKNLVLNEGKRGRVADYSDEDDSHVVKEDVDDATKRAQSQFGGSSVVVMDEPDADVEPDEDDVGASVAFVFKKRKAKRRTLGGVNIKRPRAL